MLLSYYLIQLPKPLIPYSYIDLLKDISNLSIKDRNGCDISKNTAQKHILSIIKLLSKPTKVYFKYY